ncbi:MAG: nucleoside kinase [Gemmiger sp.]|nr:nucleoside kinase [Gemmiger sp.]
MPVINIPKRLVSCDLIDFAAATPDEFISLCERQYAARIERAVDAILATPAKVVMLTGPSSVGKTTTANRLAQAITRRGKRSEVISLDDFFLGAGLYPQRAEGGDDYECPEALDLPYLRECLQSLCTTGQCEVPQFDFLLEHPSGHMRHVDGRGGAVIVEGLHALNPLLTGDLPARAVYRIYAGLREEYCGADGVRTLATRDIRLARRLVRDCLFRGHGADFTLDLWPHVCRSEDAYIRPYKKLADIQLDTSFSYEGCLWEGVLATKKAELAPGKHNQARFQTLCSAFTGFAPLPVTKVPADSMLREFVGPKKGKKN